MPTYRAPRRADYDLRRRRPPYWFEEQLDLEAVQLAEDIFGAGSREHQAARARYVERALSRVRDAVECWGKGDLGEYTVEHVVGWISSFAGAAERELMYFGPIDDDAA